VQGYAAKTVFEVSSPVVFDFCLYYCSSLSQCRALEVHGWQNKLGDWVIVFSPNDISGLRRPRNVKFVTELASSTRVMRGLRFL